MKWTISYFFSPSWRMNDSKVGGAFIVQRLMISKCETKKIRNTSRPKLHPIQNNELTANERNCCDVLPISLTENECDTRIKVETPCKISIVTLSKMLLPFGIVLYFFNEPIVSRIDGERICRGEDGMNEGGERSRKKMTSVWTKTKQNVFGQYWVRKSI